MSERSDRLDQEAGTLMDTLNTPALAAEAMAIRERDAMEDLKSEVLAFFKNRMASISRAERVKELIFQQLESDIEGGVLNFDQIMSVLTRLDRGTTESADSIISMFRPTGNGGGSLLTDIVRPDTDKSELARAFENYSSEDLRKINETMKVLRDIVESGGSVSVDTSDGGGSEG
jgi:uncharacterized protein Yka (UPF0111/DUF47 family)